MANMGWQSMAMGYGVGIARLVKKTARNIYREAADEPDDDLRKELVKHARATERQVRIDAMIESVESKPEIAVSLADLDANHWLLNVSNGTIDLTAYVQRALGYSIIGDQSKQAFFFCYGNGFNGNSTLLNACRLVLGNYATQVLPTAFIVDKTKWSRLDEAIASLKNNRLVCSTELEDGQTIHIQMKGLTSEINTNLIGRFH